MRVILLTDVPKLGKKGDIKQVADGYGRNYLIARGLAVMESEGAKKVLDKQNADAQKLDAENREKATELKEILETKTYEFKVKAKEGKVSGSVSTKQIEEAVKKDGYLIDKRKIVDSEPLNQLGTYEVKVELYKDVIATLKVILTEE
ncbi:MAG: 50S ribosomal protein L9 [Erysipelotrichaceae bacterium]|nr:50S ribosomal protein L9 [Erysipelotrichaceae bacterium]